MTLRLALAFTLAAVTGCIGIKTNPGQDRPDAAPQLDAPPDAPDPLTPHHYIIDKQVIPTTNTEAREHGLDLNGDATVDNQLGLVMSVFATNGFLVQQPADVAIDRGALLMLVDLESTGFTTGPAKLTLFTGANPQPPACNGGADPICRHHLDGNGSFIVSVASAHDPLLDGTFASGTLSTAIAGSARLHLQTSLMTPTPVTLTLLGARAQITGVTATGIATGVIAGGVVQAELDNKLLPGWQQGMNALVAQDCGGGPPDCGCAPGSTGKTLISLFDTIVHDCTISLTELKNNSLVKSLLMTDVTLDGQPALSLGIGFSAVRATYTP